MADERFASSAASYVWAKAEDAPGGTYGVDPVLAVADLVYVEEWELNVNEEITDLTGDMPARAGTKGVLTGRETSYKGKFLVLPGTIVDANTIPEMEKLYRAGGFGDGAFAAGPLQVFTLASNPGAHDSMTIEGYRFDELNTNGILTKALGARHNWVLEMPSKGLWKFAVDGFAIFDSEPDTGAGPSATPAYPSEILQALVGGASTVTLTPFGSAAYAGLHMGGEVRGVMNPIQRMGENGSVDPVAIELRPAAGGHVEVDWLIELQKAADFDWRSHWRNQTMYTLVIEQPSSAVAGNWVRVTTTVSARQVEQVANEGEFRALRIKAKTIFGDVGGDGGGLSALDGFFTITHGTTA